MGDKELFETITNMEIDGVVLITKNCPPIKFCEFMKNNLGLAWDFSDETDGKYVTTFKRN